MKLKTPPFWYRSEGEAAPLAETALSALSALYRLGYEIHQRTGRQQKFDIPILCIGNLNAGGTGKTPTALALMKTIKSRNLAHHPFFMSRGYGGGEVGPLFVDPAKHTAWHTGDEPLILAAQAPTIVAAERAQGILFALHKQADLIVMDDGLQNPHIQKTVNIVVINGEMGFGNGKMLPAGPLREPLSRGLKKADMFVLIGEDKRNVRSLLPAGTPVIECLMQTPDRLPADRPYIAFAGIGYPEKFFSFLRRSQNIVVAETIAYPDHYPYTEQDLRSLHEKAQSIGAALVTTQKDLIRLPKIPGIDVHTLRVTLQWVDEESLVQFLRSKLAA